MAECLQEYTSEMPVFHQIKPDRFWDCSGNYVWRMGLTLAKLSVKPSFVLNIILYQSKLVLHTVYSTCTSTCIFFCFLVADALILPQAFIMSIYIQAVIYLTLNCLSNSHIKKSKERSLINFQFKLFRHYFTSNIRFSDNDILGIFMISGFCILKNDWTCNKWI